VEILLVSPDTVSPECAQITSVLEERGVGVQVVDSYKQAIEELARKRYLIVVLYSFDVSSDINSTDAIRIMKKILPEVLIVAIADESRLEYERELRKFGLYYYLTKPFRDDELKDVLWGAIEKQTRRRTK
jgi:DNA-binding NtrC family response regulator